jgi:hypothetical protein
MFLLFCLVPADKFRCVRVAEGCTLRRHGLSLTAAMSFPRTSAVLFSPVLKKAFADHMHILFNFRFGLYHFLYDSSAAILAQVLAASSASLTQAFQPQRAAVGIVWQTLWERYAVL